MAGDAKLVVSTDGRRWGTIGGGCIEADVIEVALEVAKGADPKFVSHTLTAESAGDLGLSCGGTAEFFVEPIVFDDKMRDLYARVAAAIGDRVPAVVYTGAEWVGGPKKAAVFCFAEKSERREEIVAVGDLEIPDTRDISARLTHSTSFDEAAGILVELIARKPRVVIFGAGHVGVEIAKAASAVGFHVVVYDDREEFANRERVPWANEVRVEDFRTMFRDLEFDADDYLLATTRGHNFDAFVIEHIAESPARYVGMLGSRRKRAVIFRALETAGVSSEALARVRSPIGLDIGADTPAEIAVSVVAELVQVRRTGSS
jgi:xanthine dehydrogenase accessory factor